MAKMRKIQAMLYAMEHDPGIVKTVLMKYIFFIDLIHYNQRGSLLFNTSKYIRLPKGPVDSEALTISSESNQYFSAEMKSTRYGSRSKTYPTWNFRAKQNCDLSYFSLYEQKLMKMVLTALKGHQARRVSDLTHELRLWKEFSDGDAIPLDYFCLNDDEVALLDRNGLYINGFQRTFCRTMMGISEENAEAIHPLKPERIEAVEQVLDDLIRHYPRPFLDVFYDAYLAWDDTFRNALRTDPSRAPILTAKCCDAICYVSASKYLCDETEKAISDYCAAIEDEFNSVADDLILRDSSKKGTKNNYLLEQTMRLSRSMAMEMPPTGRK